MKEEPVESQEGQEQKWPRSRAAQQEDFSVLTNNGYSQQNKRVC